MTTKKILSILICLVMLMSLMPMSALATEGTACTHTFAGHTHDDECGGETGACSECTVCKGMTGGSNNPYGNNPYGNNPYGDNPYGDNPYGDNPYGNNPYGDNPDGGDPDGEDPDGEDPDGEDPDGEDPDGEDPDGEDPDGEDPDGEDPDGEDPDGEDPDGENPYGDNPYGEDPYGDNPYGEDPYGEDSDGENNPTPTTDLTVTVTGGPFTYNGTKQEPTVTVKDGETSVANTDYTVAYTNNKNAGTATVTVTGKTGTSYADKTGSATFDIAKKDATLTIGNLSKTYGDADPAITATGSGLITGESITFIYSRATGENVGTYEIGATVHENSEATAENYDIEYNRGILTITAKEINPVLKLDRTSYGYTGKAITPTVTVYDGNTVVPTEQYTVSYANNTAVGTGTVTVSAKAGGNYTFTNTAINFSIVNNVKYNVVLGNGGCWYRGSYYGLGFRCDGPYSDFIGLTIDGRGVDKSYYVSSEGSTNVGLYPQLLSLLGNGTHYITFHYTSGSATGVFYVGSTAINAVMTGDDSNVGLMALVMCLGVLSSVTILSVLRKKKSGAK